MFAVLILTLPIRKSVGPLSAHSGWRPFHLHAIIGRDARARGVATLPQSNRFCRSPSCGEIAPPGGAKDIGDAEVDDGSNLRLVI
jgi:hypothetical protein